MDVVQREEQFGELRRCGERQLHQLVGAGTQTQLCEIAAGKRFAVHERDLGSRNQAHIDARRVRFELQGLERGRDPLGASRRIAGRYVGRGNDHPHSRADRAREYREGLVLGRWSVVDSG